MVPFVMLLLFTLIYDLDPIIQATMPPTAVYDFIVELVAFTYCKVF